VNYCSAGCSIGDVSHRPRFHRAPRPRVLSAGNATIQMNRRIDHRLVGLGQRRFAPGCCLQGPLERAGRAGDTTQGDVDQRLRQPRRQQPVRRVGISSG
jgi:hypothetical protein